VNGLRGKRHCQIDAQATNCCHMTTSFSSGPWPANPLLYEINTRVWLNELSAKAGQTVTLDRIPPAELDRIARMGFQAVWLMGVWTTTGTEALRVARTMPDLLNEYRHALPDYTSEDVIGSPYAVSDYIVSPTLGGEAGLASFRNRLASFGMKLMLDFVPNHTSRDHWLVAEQPDVFVRGSKEDLARDPSSFFANARGDVIAFGRDPYFPAWTDTAQINYGSHIGRQAMKKALLSIADQCDGVRCDMAMLVLPEIIERVWGNRLGPSWNKNSFWKEAIGEVKALNPHFLMMAEAYWNLEWQLQQHGFDFTYDKTLYDRLRSNDNTGVRQHLQADKSYQQHCARFLENHDEPRAAAAFGLPRSRPMATLSFFAPGLKLLHEGQLEGRRVKLPVQLGRRPAENEDIETALFYEKILAVLQDPIFQTGTFNAIAVQPSGWGDTTQEALAAIAWTPGPETNSQALRGYLCVVNLNAWRAYGRVPLPVEVFNNNRQYVFTDRLDGKRYERQGSELISPGIYIALEAHQQHIFEIQVK